MSDEIRGWSARVPAGGRRSAAALALAGIRPGRAAAQRGTRTLKIGYVSPQTGPLAGFGETDNFVVGGIRKAVRDGLSIRGKSVPVEVLVRDSQSDPNRAAEVASRLILSDKVDLMLVVEHAGDDEPGLRPVRGQRDAVHLDASARGSRGSSAAAASPRPASSRPTTSSGGSRTSSPSSSTCGHACQTNKVVGALWPNDGDGNAWGDPKLGFPPALAKAGYKLVDPGRYRTSPTTSPRRSRRSRRRSARSSPACRSRRTSPRSGSRPPSRASGPRSRPSARRCCSRARSRRWAISATACPPRCGGRRSHPFKSSLTGASAAELAAAYTKDTKKQWTQPLGFAHALFEVAVDVLKRAASVDDKSAVRRRDQGHQARHDRGPDQLGQGAGAQRHQDPARGRPVGRAARTSGTTWSWSATGRRPSIPISGEARGPIGQA